MERGLNGFDGLKRIVLIVINKFIRSNPFHLFNPRSISFIV